MKKRIVLLAVALTVISGYGIYSWWHSDSSTNTVVYGAQPAGAVLGSSTSLVAWQTPYFATKIPTNIRHKSTTETPNNPIKASYLLTSTDPRNIDQLAVTIGSLNNYSINEISAVGLRLSQPSNYTVATRSYAPPGALVFTSTGNYETSIFWQHNDLYTAVVVSGSAADQANLEQQLTDVVSNWQWQ